MVQTHDYDAAQAVETPLNDQEDVTREPSRPQPFPEGDPAAVTARPSPASSDGEADPGTSTLRGAAAPGTGRHPATVRRTGATWSGPPCVDREEALVLVKYWISLASARSRWLRCVSLEEKRFLASVWRRLWSVVDAGLLGVDDIYEAEFDAYAFSFIDSDDPDLTISWITREWVPLDPARLGCACEGEGGSSGSWISRPRPKPRDGCAACAARNAYLDGIDATVLVRWHARRMEEDELLRDVHGWPLEDPEHPVKPLRRRRRATARIRQLVEAGYVTREAADAIERRRRSKGSLPVADEDRQD